MQITTSAESRPQMKIAKKQQRNAAAALRESNARVSGLGCVAQFQGSFLQFLFGALIFCFFCIKANRATAKIH
jgi:hypothetical protein